MCETKENNNQSSLFEEAAERILKNKSHYIESFLSRADGTAYEVTDVEGTELTYDELKAVVDNPLRKEKLSLSLRLDAEKALCRAKNKQLQEFSLLMDRNRIYEKENKRQAQLAREDFSFYNENKLALSDGERTVFGERLIKAMAEAEGTDTEASAGTYKGFDITLAVNGEERLCINISRKGGGSYSCEPTGEITAGRCIDCIETLLGNLEKKAGDYEYYARGFEVRAIKLMELLEIGNPHAENISLIEKRISEIEEEIKAGSAKT